jgi:hypothetical protein
MSDPNWTLKIKVHTLAAGKKALFNVEDTVNAFTASVVVMTANVVGLLSAIAPRQFVFHGRDFPSARFGTASAEIRITPICDATPVIDFEAWLETNE